MSSAQGALLLTYYVSAGEAKVNTYWLSNAIFLAKSTNADRHESLKQVPVKLERRWCCCLFRDTIPAPGLCRPMQIGEEGVLPTFDDGFLHAETEGSMVYNPNAKLAMARSFIALYHLIAILRHVVGILSLVRGGLGRGEKTATIDKVQACSKRLDQWFAGTRFNLYIDTSKDRSVILQNSIIYIYYQ